MESVVMVIAHKGFRDEELLEAKEVLEKNNISVKVASTVLSQAQGKLGALIKPDILFKDINLADFDALVFIGGPGSVEYWDDPLAHKLLQDAILSGKVVAGICAAAVTLAKSGILKGKRATVFSGDSQELINSGVNYTAAPLERDGNIITADGPKAARVFGEEIVKALNKN
ncbi:MAG: DJ-1/PfpI family protein [Candidatus Omnitrophota bacterium]|jgi:protease I